MYINNLKSIILKKKRKKNISLPYEIITNILKDVDIITLFNFSHTCKINKVYIDQILKIYNYNGDYIIQKKYNNQIHDISDDLNKMKYVSYYSYKNLYGLKIKHNFIKSNIEYNIKIVKEITFDSENKNVSKTIITIIKKNDKNDILLKFYVEGIKEKLQNELTIKNMLNIIFILTNYIDNKKFLFIHDRFFNNNIKNRKIVMDNITNYAIVTTIITVLLCQASLNKLISYNICIILVFFVNLFILIKLLFFTKLMLSLIIPYKKNKFININGIQLEYKD